jgi:hypothetical protein
MVSFCCSYRRLIASRLWPRHDACQAFVLSDNEFILNLASLEVLWPRHDACQAFVLSDNEFILNLASLET